ncbi:MAG: hypothetical protein EA395_13450 [Phormidium sp. GEM2.Bin31]|nr:MAG: hypothetical protein EA395_13450 [Phormidium sp. GEM2.Bin31]
MTFPRLHSLAHRLNSYRKDCLQFIRHNRLNAPLQRSLKRLRLSFLDLFSRVAQAGIKLLGNILIWVVQSVIKGYYWIRGLKPGYGGVPPRLPQSVDDLYPSQVKPRAFRSFLRQHLYHIVTLLFLGIALGFIVLFFVPVPVTFEANIISRNLSFYTSAHRDQRLLNSMRSLPRLEFEGEQTIRLFGEFDSEDMAEPLDEMNPIDIDFPYPDSKLILEDTGSSESSLELRSLRLPPQTQVDEFAYDPQRHQLSFRLTPPDGKPIPVELSLGATPLQLNLEGFESSQLSPQDPEAAGSSYNIQEFTWTPYSTELDLELKGETRIYINLPDLETTDYQEWFWGQLQVEDVKFTQVIRAEDVRDELVRSTILEGQVNFLAESLPLESEQFLILPQPETAIKRLPRIELHPDSPAGLRVRVQGKATQVAVGLDQNFPVRRLRSNFWQRWLTRDLITILLTISSVMLGYLIPWLFT